MLLYKQGVHARKALTLLRLQVLFLGKTGQRILKMNQYVVNNNPNVQFAVITFLLFIFRSDCILHRLLHLIRVGTKEEGIILVNVFPLICLYL